MRIGFVTGSIGQVGSGQAMVLPLARALQLEGHSVFRLDVSRFRTGQQTLDGITVFFEPIIRYLPARGTNVLRAAMKRRAADGGSLIDYDHPDAIELAACEAFKNLIERLDLDLVYTFHNTSALKILSEWQPGNRLLALNLVGFGIDRSRGGARDTFSIQRHLFSRPEWDLHITSTQFEYAQYLEVYRKLGIDEEKLHHIPHSFDEFIFHVNDSPSPEQDSSPIVLFYPVNVYPRKNVELAIEVLAKLVGEYDIRLVVAGEVWDEEYHKQLLSLARSLEIAEFIDFLGGVPLDGMVELYWQSDLTIFTSHQETFGIGLVESIGCGTPVVGPDWIHPCREILTDLTGGFAVSKDADDFASTIRRVLNDKPDSEMIAAEARDRYGNRTTARRFLEAAHAAEARRDSRKAELDAIDWKALYRDAGALL